jgi:hypothetical protein
MERHSPSNTTSLPTAPKGREADLGEERSGLGWTALRGRRWEQGGTTGAEVGLPYRDDEEGATAIRQSGDVEGSCAAPGRVPAEATRVSGGETRDLATDRERDPRETARPKSNRADQDRPR